MNFLAFGLILICCHAWATEIDDNFLGRGIHAHKIILKNVLEQLKSTLHKDSKPGFPIPDPYTTPKLSFKYNESDINVDANFTNLRVSGLSSYKVNSYRLVGLNVHLDLTWPNTTVNAAHYTVSNTSKVYGYDIYGDGEMNATMYNYRCVADVALVLKGKYIQIKTMALKLSLQELVFSATGLFYEDNNTSAKTSKNISEMAPEVLNQKQEMIAGDVSQRVKEILNKYLSTITLKDLLKKLHNLLYVTYAAHDLL